MPRRPTPPRIAASSPFETVFVVAAAIAAVLLAMLWGAGVLVGSILGATLPGTLTDGFAAVIGYRPETGHRRHTIASNLHGANLARRILPGPQGFEGKTPDVPIRAAELAEPRLERCHIRRDVAQVR